MREVERVPVEEMLRERRALLARLEAMAPFPGIEGIIRETRYGIERLERRMRDEEHDAGEPV